MKRLGVFILPPGWDASPSQGYPQHYAGTHLYTWVERGTVRVKYLAQEHNTMSPARPRTRTTRSRVERANHEATAPPTVQSSRVENQQTQPTYETELRNRTRATLVGGECSHHCASNQSFRLRVVLPTVCSPTLHPALAVS